MKQLTFTVAITIALGLSLIGARQAGNQTIEAAEHETYGSYLTDAEGRSLYLFANDSEGISNCYDECAENWPPLAIEGEPVAGEGIASSLLGTTTRKDGATQVTYNGLPLYYFAEDQNPGDTVGQDVGDVWYLVSPYGAAIEPEEGEEAVEEQQGQEAAEGAGIEEIPASLISEGGEVYTSTCAGCHGQYGEEGAGGPNLAGNNRLNDSSRVVRQILRGGGHMPAFGDRLSDREVAAVATFIRNSWKNTFGMVKEEEVTEAR